MNTLNLQSTALLAPVVEAPAVGLSPSRFAPLDIRTEQAPSFGTLIRIEARKVRDTRGGTAVGIGVLVLTILIPAIQLIVLSQGGVDAISFGDFYMGAATGAMFLLPVLFVQLIASEWTQRTALTTFALVPNRRRVLMAKLAAAVGVTATAFVVILGVAAAANLMSSALGNASLVWDIDAGFLIANLSDLVAAALVGFALGSLLRNTAGALVAFFSIWLVVPLTLIAMSGFRPVQVFLDWTNISMGITAVQHNLSSGMEWAHLAVAVSLWIVAPLTIGVRKILRMEIK